MITSLQNDRVKLAHGLIAGSKSRRKLGKVALEGVRLIRDAVEAGYLPEFVLYDPAAIDITSLEIPAELMLEAAPEIIQHVCATEQPQGIVGVFPLPTPSLPRDPRRVLILDAVRDPGNLGTILRTAAAPASRSCCWLPAASIPTTIRSLRSGMGAHFRVPVISQKWDEIGATCEGLAVYLAEMDGDVSYDAADWSHGLGADRRQRSARRRRCSRRPGDSAHLDPDGSRQPSRSTPRPPPRSSCLKRHGRGVNLSR